MRCIGDVEYALPVPGAVDGRLAFSITAKSTTAFRFGADFGRDHGLLASADEEAGLVLPCRSRSSSSTQPADAKGRWENLASVCLAVGRGR